MQSTKQAHMNLRWTLKPIPFPKRFARKQRKQQEKPNMHQKKSFLIRNIHSATLKMSQGHCMKPVWMWTTWQRLPVITMQWFKDLVNSIWETPAWRLMSRHDESNATIKNHPLKYISNITKTIINNVHDHNNNSDNHTLSMNLIGLNLKHLKWQRKQKNHDATHCECYSTVFCRGRPGEHAINTFERN